MFKAVAILLLISTFVGAEEKLTGQTSPTPAPAVDADKGKVNEGSNLSPSTAASDPGEDQEDNHQDLVSSKKEQIGETAQEEEEHVHKESDSERRKEVETELDPVSGSKSRPKEGDKIKEHINESSKEIKAQYPGSDSKNQPKEEEEIEETIIDESSEETKTQDPVSDSKGRPKEEEKIEEIMDESSEETKTLKNSIHDKTGKVEENWDVSMKCLDCLCEFVSECELERACVTPKTIFGLEPGMEEGDCGPFHISFPFWADAFDVPMKTDDAELIKRWKWCSLDFMCATEAIQKYFHTYPHDCNNDGKVDCLDYAAIHTLGPFGCKVQKNLQYWNRMNRKEILQCMASPEEGIYTKKMRELTEKFKLQDMIAGMKMRENGKTEAQNAPATSGGKADDHIRGGIVQF